MQQSRPSMAQKTFNPSRVDIKLASGDNGATAGAGDRLVKGPGLGWCITCQGGMVSNDRTYALPAVHLAGVVREAGLDTACGVI